MKSMAICPMLTAFTDSGSLDFDANERQIERLIAGGIDGIIFLGSIGEFSAISMEQKEEFSKFAIGRVNGRVRTIVGTSCASMEDTLRMNSVVCEAGADSAMILPPYYFAADEETLYRYYSLLRTRLHFPLCCTIFPLQPVLTCQPILCADWPVSIRKLSVSKTPWKILATHAH